MLMEYYEYNIYQDNGPVKNIVVYKSKRMHLPFHLPRCLRMNSTMRIMPENNWYVEQIIYVINKKNVIKYYEYNF